MVLGDLIRQYRAEHNMNMQDFADACGLSKAYISILERNFNPKSKKPPIPTLETIQAVGKVIGMSFNELIGKLDRSQEIDLSLESLAVSEDSMRPGIRIPVLGLVPAGIPIEAIEDIVDWEEIPAAMCSGERQYFGLRVKGDSMYPDYLDGDTIIVRKTPAFESGDVCVVYVNGYDATLKRVKVDEDGAWTLIPRNPEYPPKTYSAQEVQTVPVSIAGVVVELRRKVK